MSLKAFSAFMHDFSAIYDCDMTNKGKNSEKYKEEPYLP